MHPKKLAATALSTTTIDGTNLSILSILYFNNGMGYNRKPSIMETRNSLQSSIKYNPTFEHICTNITEDLRIVTADFYYCGG